MSHRHSANSTHDVLVRRRVEVEGGDPDDPFDDGDTSEEYRYLALAGNDEVWVDEEAEATAIPVVLNPGGSSYVRSETGETVTETDTVRWPTDYAEPKEGDRLEFDALGERLVEGISERSGRRGISHYELELGGT